MAPTVTFHNRNGINSIATDSKKVSVSSNTTITCTPKEPTRRNPLVTVKTGNEGVAITFGSSNDLQAYAELTNPAYSVMTKIIKMDKSDPKGEKLTDDDLAKLHADYKAGKKITGVTKVRRDADAGVTTVILEGGDVLRFDFETAAEKKSRLNANG